MQNEYESTNGPIERLDSNGNFTTEYAVNVYDLIRERKTSLVTQHEELSRTEVIDRLTELAEMELDGARIHDDLDPYGPILMTHYKLCQKIHQRESTPVNPEAYTALCLYYAAQLLRYSPNDDENADRSAHEAAKAWIEISYQVLEPEEYALRKLEESNEYY